MTEPMGIENIVSNLLDLKGYHAKTNVSFLKESTVKQGSHKNSDIDVLAENNDGKVIAVECKAPGDPFEYKNYNTDSRIDKFIAADDSLGGLIDNIKKVRDGEYRHIDDSSIDEYWFVMKGFVIKDDDKSHQQFKDSREAFEEEVRSRLGEDSVEIFQTDEILTELLKKVKSDAVRKRDRYNSPINEAFRHICASANDNHRALDSLIASLESLKDVDWDQLEEEAKEESV